VLAKQCPVHESGHSRYMYPDSSTSASRVFIANLSPAAITVQYRALSLQGGQPARLSNNRTTVGRQVVDLLQITLIRRLCMRLVNKRARAELVASHLHAARLRLTLHIITLSELLFSPATSLSHAAAGPENRWYIERAK